MNRCPSASGRAWIASLRRRLRAPCLVIACALILSPRASAAPAEEMRVHAAYLMNFIRYSRWPNTGDAPLEACVLGSAEALAAIRDAAVRFRGSGGNEVRVVPIALASMAPDLEKATAGLRELSPRCHVLYVGQTHASWSRAVAAAAAGRAVLTVGPGEAFVQLGGMIGLYLEEGNVRFNVNVAAIRRSPVDVSSRILVLARPPMRRR